jgi:signal transduction histidine kinase/FixJ family two-component response regulator
MFWRGLLALLFTLLILPFVANAAGMTDAAGAAEAGAEAAPPIDAAAVDAEVPLTPHLSMLKDFEARLSPTAALSSSLWRPVVQANMSQGFTRSVVWLKVAIRNDSQVPQTRWLTIGPSRLEDVRLYTTAAAGAEIAANTADIADAPALSAERRAGTIVPIAERDVPTALSVFPITLRPGEQILALVRVQSRTSMQLSAKLWLPREYLQSERAGSMLNMLSLGVMLMIALLSVALAAVWRDRVFALLAASIALEVVYVFSYEGYIYEMLLRQGGDLVVRLPSVVGSLVAAFFSATVVAFVGLRRAPLWKWIYRVLIAAILAGSIWTLLGDYRVSTAVSINAVFLCNLAWLLSMADGWRRGLPNAKLMLLAFAPDGVTLCLRLLALLGLLPPRWSAGPSQLWDSVSMTLLMLFVVAGRSRQVYREQRQAQRELMDSRVRERDRLEHAVQARTAELQQAMIAADEANRAKGDFLARISHDLRTPLTSIIGFADLVRAGGREHSDRGHIIRRNADHMLGLVNDLIDYAGGHNVHAVHSEPVYIYAMIDAVGQNAVGLAGRNRNAFSVDIQNDLPPVLELDGKRVQQILGNLIDNAAKFTSDGFIGLTIGCLPAQADHGPPGGGQHHGHYRLILSVSDTGCGIAPQDQATIFEPFSRLGSHAHHPGVGLGLAIVKQWTERMSGSIHVTSALGAGTTVTVQIPVRTASEADMGFTHFPEPLYTLPVIDGRSLCILVAEDTAEIRQLIEDDLSSQGFEVVTAHDGEEAIGRLANNTARVPDLVITDLLMPHANGDAVLVAARRYHPGVPVVALSATPRLAGHTGAMPENVDDYDARLLKPVSLVELRHTVAHLLGLAEEHEAEEETAISRPRDEALDEARQFVELGAISDLIDWTDRLAGDEPEYASFAAAAGRLARLGELSQLKTLLYAEGR